MPGDSKELKISSKVETQGLKQLKTTVVDLKKTLDEFSKNTLQGLIKQFNVLGAALGAKSKEFKDFRDTIESVGKSLQGQRRIIQEFSSSMRGIRLPRGLNVNLNVGGGGGAAAQGGFTPPMPSRSISTNSSSSGGGNIVYVSGGGGTSIAGGTGGGGGYIFTGGNAGGGGAGGGSGAGGGGNKRGGISGFEPDVLLGQAMSAFSSNIIREVQGKYQNLASVQNFRSSTMQRMAGGDLSDVGILLRSIPQLSEYRIGNEAVMSGRAGEMIGGMASLNPGQVAGGFSGMLMDTVTNQPAAINAQTFQVIQESLRKMDPERGMMFQNIASTANSRLQTSRRIGSGNMWRANSAGAGVGLDFGQSLAAAGAISDQFGSTFGSALTPAAMKFAPLGFNTALAGSTMGQIAQARMLTGEKRETALTASISEFEDMLRRSVASGLKDVQLQEMVAQAITRNLITRSGPLETSAVEAMTRGIAGGKSSFEIQARAQALSQSGGPINQFVQGNSTLMNAQMAGLLQAFPGMNRGLLSALARASPMEAFFGSQGLKDLGFRGPSNVPGPMGMGTDLGMGPEVLQQRFGNLFSILSRDFTSPTGRSLKKSFGDRFGGNALKFFQGASDEELRMAASGAAGILGTDQTQTQQEFKAFHDAFTGGTGPLPKLPKGQEDSTARGQVQAMINIQNELFANEKKWAQDLTQTFKNSTAIFKTLGNLPADWEGPSMFIDKLKELVNTINGTNAVQKIDRVTKVLKANSVGVSGGVSVEDAGYSAPDAGY